MKKIMAAGGIVRNENEELLMIFRRGKWDLPKGKLDAGEDLATCALREVQEETGLQNLELKDFIGSTRHTYFDKYLQEDVVKETHWYAMLAKGAEKLIPQTEEDITAIQWLNKNDVDDCLQNTYPNIRQVLTLYFNREVPGKNP